MRLAGRFEFAGLAEDFSLNLVTHQSGGRITEHTMLGFHFDVGDGKRKE